MKEILEDRVWRGYKEGVKAIYKEFADDGLGNIGSWLGRGTGLYRVGSDKGIGRR